MFEVVWLSLFVWFASKAQDLAFAFAAGAAYQPLACPCQVAAEWDVSNHCMKDAPTAAGISRPVEAISGRRHTLLLSPSGPPFGPSPHSPGTLWHPLALLLVPPPFALLHPLAPRIPLAPLPLPQRTASTTAVPPPPLSPQRTASTTVVPPPPLPPRPHHHCSAPMRLWQLPPRRFTPVRSHPLPWQPLARSAPLRCAPSALCFILHPCTL